MEAINTVDKAFDIGTWVGRRQAFALVAGRCSAADADTLAKIRDEKLYLQIEPTWDRFCVNRIGATRSYVDRVIRQARELGPDFCKLSCFTRIKPSEYRLIAGAVTEDGLAYAGEVIALEPENAPKLAEAVEALCRDSAAETPADPTEQSFAKAEKAVKTAIAEFQRLQGMKLDDDARLKLAIALESCRNQLDLIWKSTDL